LSTGHNVFHHASTTRSRKVEGGEIKKGRERNRIYNAKVYIRNNRTKKEKKRVERKKKGKTKNGRELNLQKNLNNNRHNN
jgi:hypothetical protein